MVLVHTDFSGLPIIAESLGGWHEYFARAAGRVGARVVELYLEGAPIAQSVVYPADLGGYVLGVLYYVAVRRNLRGKGFGGLLLSCSEQVLSELGAKVYAATVERGNTPSLSLFKSKGYTLHSWGEVSKVCGRRVAESLKKATCGYEEVFALKGATLRGLCGLDHEKAEKLWREGCLKPWLALKAYTM